jgi:hypothetical protein
MSSSFAYRHNRPSLPPAENELASSLAVAGQAHFAERRTDLVCPFACSKSQRCTTPSETACWCSNHCDAISS